MYLLMCMGFGLSIAPKAMTAIVECVLAQDKKVKMAAICYIDDVMVDETVLPVGKVAEHLLLYGLETKVPEHIGINSDVRVTKPLAN